MMYFQQQHISMMHNYSATLAELLALSISSSIRAPGGSSSQIMGKASK